MPTQRKRIGFLPSVEVQNLIDKICIHNKLSQSKVTGILVEEALYSRGILHTSINKLSIEFDSNSNDSILNYNDTFNSKIHNDDDHFNLDDPSIKAKVQMINDFIEFKFFKNIMNRNQSKN